MGKDVRAEVLKDAATFAKHWIDIQSLRASLSVESDVLLNPVHFLAATDSTRRSCSVVVWRGDRLIGLMYATQHYLKGIATGYAIGGDYSGRGLLLCSAPEESLVLRESVRQMVSDGVHSLHLRFLPRDGKLAKVKGLKYKTFDAVIPGDLLQLQPDYEDFLSTLGKHTRRNIRACIRKTEQIGIAFVPSLSKEEYDCAVERLNSETDFPADPLKLARDERLLLLHDGERMGLRAEDGTIIAVMCGFRQGDRFHLMTQLNDSNYERLSLSLVLRAYVTKHLIENGLAYLHFMGGSSLSFGRYCQPENYRSIFIDRRAGLAAAAKALASRVVRVMQSFGKAVPESLAVICNGHLDDASLTERTVLRPAAMLLSQRDSQPKDGQAVTGADVPGEPQRPLLRVRASI
jgi:hypothetical protein